MSTWRSAATASRITSLRRPWVRRKIASRNCSPMLNTGLSEVCGSCRIIEIRLPRISRISRGVLVQEVVAAQQHLAAQWCAPRPSAAAA